MQSKKDNRQWVLTNRIDSEHRRFSFSVREAGREFKMQCSCVLLAIGRGPDSFLQKQAHLKMGKHDSIAISDNYKTSMERVLQQATLQAEKHWS